MLRHRILILFLSLSLSLVLLELGARLLITPPRTHQQAALQFERKLGFGAIPSSVQRYDSPLGNESHDVEINRDGFRGRLLPDAKGRVRRREEAAGRTERIAIFGDSFGVAEAVPESEVLAQRLEDAMRSQGQDAEVYNLSTIDYGTGQELLLFDRVVSRVEPDTVVLLVFPTNDVVNNTAELAGRTPLSPGDALRPYVFARGSGDLASDTPVKLKTSWVNPVRGALRSLSFVFALIEHRFAPPRVPKTHLSSKQERLLRGDPPREFLEVYRSHEADNAWAKGWSHTERLLLAFRARCRAIDARLLVVVVPGQQQVEQTPQSIGFEIEMARAGLDIDDVIDWSSPEVRLAEFLGTNGIEYELLLDDLRLASAMDETVYSRDLHLSTAGHAIAAKRIAAHLGVPPGSLANEVLDPSSRAGRPVLFSGESDPVQLDFRAAHWSSRMSEGWLQWRPASASHPGGWQLGQSGVISLREGEGPFVIRGIAAGPMILNVGFVGAGPRRQHRITRAGPFEIRLVDKVPVATSQSGHALVVVNAGTHVGQVIIQDVGFEGTRRQADTRSLGRAVGGFRSPSVDHSLVLAVGTRTFPQRS